MAPRCYQLPTNAVTTVTVSVITEVGSQKGTLTKMQLMMIRLVGLLKRQLWPAKIVFERTSRLRQGYKRELGFSE